MENGEWKMEISLPLFLETGLLISRTCEKLTSLIQLKNWKSDAKGS